MDQVLGSTPLTAKLKDGAIIETSNLDDILSLENAASKSIERVTLNVCQASDTPDWSIDVSFQDGMTHPGSWNSVELSVVGLSRDWVFVASAELEDRLKKTRTVSWPYLFSQPWLLLVPVFIGMMISSTVTDYLMPRYDYATQLEEMRQEGKITDALDAIIELERLRRVPRPMRSLATMAVVFGTPFAVFTLGLGVIPRCFPSYNFYWGDYIAYYDRRRNIARVFWGVLVLGVVSSIIAGLVLRVF